QIDNIEDPLDDNLANNQTKTSSSLSLSLGNQRYGSLSYSLSYSQYYGDKKDNYSNTISYGKRFPFMSFNISYQKSSNFEDRTFVNINVPINNSSSFSTQYQHYKTSSLTTNYSNYHNDLFRYSIGATADKDSKDKNISGNINATTAYSQISATGSFSNSNQKSAMLTASGAIAYSDGLFATSPVELGDTFGILRVPGQSGILVNSMGGGTTITNHFGTAVIPNLPVNKKTTVLLNTKNLPLNVMLGTTSFDIALAKGTVFSREIPVNTMKQVLLEIKKPDGKPVNTANSVIDDKGNLIGVIMGDGNVIISNEQIGKPLKVKSDNGDICSVDYSVPEEFNPDFLYEKVDAICK
ncbi:TPA: fimbria/pilus outer membrane usher protein, partial [Proteus mirabilis]